jgi:hypothetical protein
MRKNKRLVTEICCTSWSACNLQSSRCKNCGLSESPSPAVRYSFFRLFCLSDSIMISSLPQVVGLLCLVLLSEFSIRVKCICQPIRKLAWWRFTKTAIVEPPRYWRCANTPGKCSLLCRKDWNDTELLGGMVDDAASYAFLSTAACWN